MATRRHQDRWVDLLVVIGLFSLGCGLVLVVVVLVWKKDVGLAGNWASVVSACVALFVAITALVGWQTRRRRVIIGSATAEQVAQARATLAGLVRAQWRREAEVRSLGDPDPMPVRWYLTDSSVMDHPRLIAPGNRTFAGRSDQIGLLCQ